jgi:predicted component of type VI protein secretion system
MKRVPYSGPTIRVFPVYLTLGALSAQYMWSNTHFGMYGKICTKHAENVMCHRIKFSRQGDRDLCTRTLNYPSVRNKKTYLRGTGPFSYVCT